ncbi:hypothetical protein LguiB_014552 [Lonicera macranthoides]
MRQLSAQAVEEDTWKRLEGSNPMFLGHLIPISAFFMSLMILIPPFALLVLWCLKLGLVVNVDNLISYDSIVELRGYEAPNLRKIADKVGAAGFYAVVPDFFLGDPFLPENAERPTLTWLKDHAQSPSPLPLATLFSHLPLPKLELQGLRFFVLELHYDFLETEAEKIVVELAKHAYVQAAVILDPSFVTVEDINGVKVPILMLGAATDHRSPPEVLKQFEEALKAKSEVDFFVKIFPGVAHGWSLRYKEGDEHIVKCVKEAHQDMLDWFIKYLK